MRGALLQLGLGSLWLASVQAAERSQPGQVEFNRDIRPILADYCFECHGPDEESRKGDLRLDLASAAHEFAVRAGEPETSPLLQRMLTHDEAEVMPPPESPRQPKKRHLELLRRWIAQGAEYDTHWSFRELQQPAPAEVQNREWGRNTIDTFVLGRLESKGLAPRPDEEATVLARRLSLAITGLPPMPGQMRRFAERFEQDPDRALASWADELLSSPAYGEHQAWSWLDAARYSDTNGYQADGPRLMWRWRDWLIEALNANLPYDQLTEQMLAGDLLAPAAASSWATADWIPDRESSALVTATGFLRNHRYDTGSGTIPAEAKFENAADRLETVGTVWLGLTLQCARCHTHKFDPIEQTEYYQLLSFFDNVPEVGAALKNASHPYIHTPTEEQLVELQRLKAEANQAHASFRKALAVQKEIQQQWEHSSPTEATRVQRSLRYRHAQKTLHFDGKTRIEKPNDPILLTKGSARWSISFWFRPEGPDKGAIFSSVEEPERYRPGIQADWVDGRIRLRHVCRWVNSYIEFQSAEKLQPGKWHHVTFRSDSRMQGLGYRASLNGSDEAMVCTHEVTNDSAEKSGKAPLLLGGSPLFPNYRGDLRDLRFYDRTLSPEEARSLADPRSTAEIAAIPVSRRTTAEQRILDLAFLESEALPDRIASLQRRHFETREALRTAIQETPTTMVMKEVDLGPTRLHAMGAYDQPTDPVEPGTPHILPAFPESEALNRLGLARWLTQPGHPLTARVAVNRIWQSLWGHGFVDNPENFGSQSAEPLQSDLLDWLAAEYVRLGWDTKQLIRLIVTSRSYRQSSAADDRLWQSDPDNRLLARGPRFRLPIHTIRDQALHLSGRMQDEVGGPPVLIDPVLGKDGKPVRLNFDQNEQRRTLYTYWKRNAPHPMLAVYDVADRNQCDVRQRRTNTPLQALVTLNERGFAAAAEALGKRAVRAADRDEDRLFWIWLACTGRQPRAETQRELKASLERYRELAHHDPQQAWTTLANVLLNLDASLSLE